MIINGYKLKGELKNANSGFSKWTFAEKDGKDFFIKELINPVYPIDESAMTAEMFSQGRAFCERYEERMKQYFERINSVSRGNLIRINHFFRCGSKYYIVTDRIFNKPLTLKYISSLDVQKKILLIKSVVSCFFDLHSADIIHFDVKPSNLLIKITKNGNFAAKLIDFDSGFFSGENLQNSEPVGDLTYLAPEVFLNMCGENTVLSSKADIFSLGLVIHEFFCGSLPAYDETAYEYPYEAVLDGGILEPKKEMMPRIVFELIVSMLNKNPDVRPTAGEILQKLNGENTDSGKDSAKPNQQGQRDNRLRTAGNL